MKKKVGFFIGKNLGPKALALVAWPLGWPYQALLDLA
jgi:hypothetical protein